MLEAHNVDLDPLYGISICAGALGLDLGIETAIPQYRTAVMVEREISVAARIAARVHEGSVPAVAQWTDVATFDGRPWRGRLQALSAGFPCQPFSVAGKRAGTADARWIWPDIVRVIGEIFGSAGDPDREEALLFLENVPGLLLDPDRDLDRWALDDAPDDALGGMGTVLRDLAELGFIADAICLRASDVGAAHGRKRVFILAYRGGGSVAYTGCAGGGQSAQPSDVDGTGSPDHDRGASREVGDAGDAEWGPGDERGGRGGAGSHGEGEASGRPRIGNGALGDAARTGRNRQDGENGGPGRWGVRETDRELGDPGRAGLPEPEPRTVLGAGRGEEGGAAREPSEFLEARKLAHPSGGGLRELRQPSGGDRFSDGRGALVELAGGVLDGRAGFSVGGSLGETPASPDGARGEAVRGSTPRADGELEYAHDETRGVEPGEQPQERAEVPGGAGGNLPIFAIGPADPRWNDVLVQYPWLRPSLAPAEAESYFRDLADGLAALLVDERTAALRTLGNGVVPLQAVIGFRILMRRMGLVLN